MRPFHHGDAGGASQNWLQRFNDSDAGVLLAGTLHSVGALLFAGGIALYLYVAHSMRRAAREDRPAHVGLLIYAHGFTIVGIVLNGLGGVMRLYEGDHPKLDRLGDSTWVQVLLVKHLFLVAGVGLALWLAWRTRRVARLPPHEASLEPEASRMAWYAAASLSTILLAAVLGAVAGNVDLAADLGQSPPLSSMDDGHAAHGEAQVLAEFSTSGVITGTPGQPGVHDDYVTVPEGADRITVVLTWSTASAQGLSPVEMSVGLKDGEDQPVTGQETRVDRALTVVVPPERVRPGRWTVSVVSERAVQESYELHVTAVRSEGHGNVINRTVRVEPGTFFEANLLMESGQSISFEWALLNTTTRKVHFDVHMHEGEQVRYAVNGDYNAYDGNYTHTGPTQGPSLLWENGGSDAVEIHVRVTGEFAVHSYHPA
jgi:uncharacterized membrane protein